MRCTYDSKKWCYVNRPKYSCFGCLIFTNTGQTMLMPPHEIKKREVFNRMPTKYAGGNPDFDLPLISTIEIGTELEIAAVKFGEGAFGEYAVIDTAKHGVIRSGNTVILNQLHEIAETIEKNNDSVLVKFNKVPSKVKGHNPYYVFEAPDAE